MNKPFTIQLFSVLINILVCLVAVTARFVTDNTLTINLIFWTIPLALALSVTGNSIVNLRVSPFIVRLLIFILTAILLSYGWIIIQFFFPFFIYSHIGLPLEFSYSITLFIWISGSILQLLFLDRFLPKRAKRVGILKVIIGLLSFPLISIPAVIALSFVNLYLSQPEKEFFFISEGYVGHVFISFNQPDGEKPEYDDSRLIYKLSKRRIYRIPKTGVLFTQFNDSREEGNPISEFFYIKNGQRLKLGTLESYDFINAARGKKSQKLWRDSVAVFDVERLMMNDSKGKTRKII